ncbi:MAG TPA: hypothetical protein VFV62_07670 [Gaiellaceae bacterium]|nr:hypothetical protein [Gaiellaceae bacterium]
MIPRLLTTVCAALLLTGCSTEEGLRAQELLQQAEVAQQALVSSTFEGAVSVAFGAQKIALEFNGATSNGGEWLSMRSTGIPDGGDFAMQVLMRGGRVWTNFGGGWTSGPAPTGLGSTGTVSSAAFQQLARYVKDVRVNEHQLVGGKTVTTIGGEIDTQGMVQAVMKLGSVAGDVEGLSLDFSKLGVDFGDIEALLTIDERTHLLDTAFVKFSVAAQGEEVDLQLRYRLTSANEPVELPSP